MRAFDRLWVRARNTDRLGGAVGAATRDTQRGRERETESKNEKEKHRERDIERENEQRVETK